MYGWSQEQCWIKTSENNNCMFDSAGLTIMLVFDYGPGLLAVLTVFILLVTIFTVMCRRAVRVEHRFCQPSVHQKGLKEVLPLLLYPPILRCTMGSISGTRIYDVAVNVRVQERNSMIPWLVYSIATYLK